MAFLKDLIVNGASRIIGPLFASSIQTDTIKAPTSSNGTTFGSGTNGQILKSNGSKVYWANETVATTVESANKLTNARNITIGDAAQSFNGASDISFDKDDINMHYSNIQPLHSKTFTGVYAAANNDANNYKYYGKIIPTSYKTLWRVKVRVTAYVPSYPDYCTSSVIEMNAMRNTYSGYYCWNNNQNTSYRGIYYHTFRFTSSEANSTVHGHIIGFSLASCANNTNANYARTVKVEVLETDGCTFSFLGDNVVIAADLPNASAYGGNSNFDAASTGLQETGDSNTYDRTYFGANILTNGGSDRLTRYSMLGFDREGRTQPFSTYSAGYTSYTASVNTARVYNTNGFDYTRGVFYMDSNINLAPDTTATSTASVYFAITGLDLRYSDNAITSYNPNTFGLLRGKPVYLRGVIKSDGLFYVAPFAKDAVIVDGYYKSASTFVTASGGTTNISSYHTISGNYVYRDITSGKYYKYASSAYSEITDLTPYKNYQKAWTQTVPSSVETDADGNQYVYMLLGIPYYNGSYPDGGYQLNLFQNNPVYWYHNGRFEAYAIEDNTKLPLTGGTLSNSLNFSGSADTAALHWNSGAYRQKIFVNDDSVANTDVFKFQQSEDSGVSYKDLMKIKDNGEVVATTFTGKLNGNADTVDGFHIFDNGEMYTSVLSLDFSTSSDVYVKITLNGYQYYGRNVKFFIQAPYDNTNGSTRIDTYCRARKFYINSTSYNGNNLKGFYQETANTNIYYLKLNGYRGSINSNINKPYSASGHIDVYCTLPLQSLEEITSTNTKYTEVTNYVYEEVINNGGITANGIWGNISSYENNKYNLGESNNKWKNVYATSFTGDLTGKVNNHTVNADVPSGAVFTDTKNTAGSTDSSSKLFLIGATSQAANPQTYSQDTAYVGTDGYLYSNSVKVEASALINQLTLGSSTPADNDYYVSQYVGGGTTTTSYHRRPMSALWSYIKTKIGSAGSSLNPTYVKDGVETACGGNVVPYLTGGTHVAARYASETRTGDSKAETYYYPTDWKYNGGLTPTNGMLVLIEMPGAGHDYGVFLSVNNGTSYHPVVREGASRLTTHVASGMHILLVFDSDGSAGDMFVRAGAKARSTVSGGVWRIVNFREDGNSGVYQNYSAKPWKVGTTALTAYDLVCEDANGLLIPAHSVAHQVGCQVYITDGAKSANSTGSWTGMYDRHYNYPIRKAGSTIGTHVNYAKVYLHGTIDGSTFTPNTTTPYVIGTENCNTKGHFYMYVGDMTTSSGYVAYNNSHPYYYYTGSSLICTTVPPYGGSTS